MDRTREFLTAAGEFEANISKSKSAFLIKAEGELTLQIKHYIKYYSVLIFNHSLNRLGQ